MAKKDYNKVEHKGLDVLDDEEVDVEEEKKKLQAVVSEKPKKYKKGLMERLVVGLIGPDGARKVGHEINNEIIIPAIKNIIVDSITSGINMAIFGDDAPPRGNSYNKGYSGGNSWGARPSSRYKPKTNYGRSYGRNTIPMEEGRVEGRRPVRGNQPFVSNHIIADRNEALAVLNGLREQIMDFGVTSVADYYDLIGEEPTYTDNDHGWTDLEYAKVQPVRGGYILQLPPTEVL